MAAQPETGNAPYATPRAASRVTPHAAHPQRSHTAFGLALRIDSRISMPELGRSRGHRPAASPSHIRLDPDELHRRWRDVRTTPVRVREVRDGQTLVRSVDFDPRAGYLLWARDYGHVLIAPDGSELLCAPDPANAGWASILALQALPLAATLRGLEVLHASGVVLQGQAVLFSGPSGAGKSSLAAALLRAGAQLLSDDVCALAANGAGGLTVHGGSLALQLRSGEHRQLSAAERAALGEAAGTVEAKRRYICPATADCAPLGGLFLLERFAAGPAAERIETVSPFALLAATFNLSVRTPARLQRQLEIVAALAASGRIYRLRIQPGVDATTLAALASQHLTADDARRPQPQGSSARLPAARALEL